MKNSTNNNARNVKADLNLAVAQNFSYGAQPFNNGNNFYEESD